MSGKSRVLITGCSSAGKSTLLDAIRAAGRIVVSEPGRRIVESEQTVPTGALPWENPIAFARCTKAIALKDLVDCADTDEAVYFDRGLLDAMVALHHATGLPIADRFAADFPYSDVFVAEPWPELFENDASRRHTFEDAVAEYDRIIAALNHIGRAWHVLPKVSVSDRLSLVLAATSKANGPRSYKRGP